MLLTREAFLEKAKALALPYEDHTVEGLGTVRVRGLSVAERTRFELSISMGKGRDRDINIREMREKLLVLCLVDETGAALLREDDKAAIGLLPAKQVEFLFDRARSLSGMTQADVDALGNG